MVVRRPRAADDAIAIWRYVAADSELYADALTDRFDAKLAQLAEFPQMERARPELGDQMRSVVVGNYVLFYQPLPDGIELIRILHGARDVGTALLD